MWHVFLFSLCVGSLSNTHQYLLHRPVPTLVPSIFRRTRAQNRGPDSVVVLEKRQFTVDSFCLPAIMDTGSSSRLPILENRLDGLQSLFDILAELLVGTATVLLETFIASVLIVFTAARGLVVLHVKVFFSLLDLWATPLRPLPSTAKALILDVFTLLRRRASRALFSNNLFRQGRSEVIEPLSDAVTQGEQESSSN